MDLVVPLLLIVLSAAGLRYSWGLPRRSGFLNAGAWLTGAAGLFVLTNRDGAWGLSIGLSAALVVTVILLGWAAIRGPGRRPQERGPERATARAMRGRGNFTPEPVALGRRSAWFLLSVPGAAGAALLWAMAGQGLARAGGWHPADSGALPFLLMPTVWGLLAGGMLMASGLRGGLFWLIAASIPAAAILTLTI